MEWSETIQLWSQTPVKIIDIRHIILKPWEETRAYRLPANAFLFANQGEAWLRLDGIDVSSMGYHVLHSGKDSILLMKGLNRSIDYYLILYRGLASSRRSCSGFAIKSTSILRRVRPLLRSSSTREKSY